ncbi:hypothetical protein ACP6M7_13855, partial [Corynebacterium striatum]|uniref:hypothetical protein n=1 Tax=Corynebacterium striatum TaxID=43770 RepID=UPI003F7FA3DA
MSASTIPVEKGYLELEDDKNVENFVDCREIRTVFKPTWVSWWFHKIFTFPRVECDGIVSNCHWGRDKALVKDGGTVTVGFSYRIFHDTLGGRLVVGQNPKEVRTHVPTRYSPADPQATREGLGRLQHQPR